MIVRCAGCGTTVSEWAQRCTRCGRTVEESLAEVEPAAVAARAGGRSVESLLLGDQPVDAASAVWSPDPSRLTILEPPPAPADDGTGAVTGPDEAATTSAHHRRRVAWAAAGAVALVLVVVGVLVAGGGGGGGDATVPRFDSAEPPQDQPLARWSTPEVFSDGSFPVSQEAYVLAGDTVVGVDGETVTAYDAATGQVRWTKNRDNAFELPRLDVAGNVVLLSGRSIESGTGLLALDAATGAQQWSADGFVLGVSDGHASMITLTEDAGVLSVVDTTTGETVDLEGDIVAAYEDTFVLRRGDELALYRIGATQPAATFPAFADSNGAVTRSGPLLLEHSDETLSAYDAGGKRWSTEVAGDSDGLLTVDERRVLVSVLGDQNQLTLVEIGGDKPTVRWTTPADLRAVVTRDRLVVFRGEQTELVRVGDQGLTTVAVLGQDEVRVLAVGDDRIVVQTARAVTAFTYDGTTAWTIEVVEGADVTVVDGGIVVIDPEGLTFYA